MGPWLCHRDGAHGKTVEAIVRNANAPLALSGFIYVDALALAAAGSRSHSGLRVPHFRRQAAWFIPEFYADCGARLASFRRAGLAGGGADKNHRSGGRADESGDSADVGAFWHLLLRRTLP